MQFSISTEIILWFSIGFIIGFFFGCIFQIILSKRIIVIEKIINIIIVLVWISLHIYWFINNIKISMLFNIMWFISVWHLLWFKTSDYDFISNFISKLKNK